MKCLSLLVSVFYFGTCCVSGRAENLPATTQADVTQSAVNQIENMLVTESDGATVLVLESSKALRYYADSQKNPPSVSLTFDDPVEIVAALPENFDKTILQEITYVYSENSKNVKSIQLRLNGPFQYNITQNDWTISVLIKPLNSKTSEKKRPEPPRVREISNPLITTRDDQTSEDFTQDLKLSPMVNNILRGLQDDYPNPPRLTLPMQPSLQDFVRVALANNHNLGISQQENSLAKKKLFEARRAFFPSLTGRITDTEGKTLANGDSGSNSSNVSSFTRKELGVEFGQPLFQSGRIYYAKKQSEVQVGVSQIQMQKLVNDTTFDTIKALMTFLQARETLVLRRNLEDTVKIILETTRKKRDLGLASESELLGAAATETQVQYKVISQEKDNEYALSNLLKFLGLQELPPLSDLTIDSVSKTLSTQKITLEQLARIASISRPEIKIAYLNKKGREYGRKSARAETLVKVDASGFFGQAGSAFQSETLTMKDSYNVGVRASLYFAGNSLSPLLSNEKTAPDLGSTSRSETNGRTINVGLLDSLGYISSYQQAKIDEAKAEEELRKSKKDIEMEVQEAYYNFQKAEIQIDFANKELVYRTKEIAIANARDKVHSIETSELIQAETALSEAEISVREATAFWVISYFALEKAIGKKLQ